MKKILFSVLTVFIFSCQDEKKEPEIVPVTETSKPLPEFAYPVDRSHWKIGDPANTKTVLDMYHAWDANDANGVAGFFADSAMLDLPNSQRMVLNKDNVYEKFGKARKQYTNTSHKIISAISLHNNDLNEDWVQILCYNKWAYPDGARDSMLYFDNWRLKSGKIDYLNTLEQTPPTPLLKKLEAK
jgi:hypothetical protein